MILEDIKSVTNVSEILQLILLTPLEAGFFIANLISENMGKYGLCTNNNDSEIEPEIAG